MDKERPVHRMARELERIPLRIMTTDPTTDPPPEVEIGDGDTPWRGFGLSTKTEGRLADRIRNLDLTHDNRFPQIIRQMQESRVPIPNPLKGYSLGYFSPESPIRKWALSTLTHPATEPIILFLIIAQAGILIAQCVPTFSSSAPEVRWGSDRKDWAMLAVFIVYTVELTAKIIVSGLVVGHNDSSVRFQGIPQAENVQDVVRQRLAQTAFLRHSFNRMDFVAVVSFWINLSLTLATVVTQHDIRILRLLSCFRCLRLLALTGGTSVVLRTALKAFPLLFSRIWNLIAFFVVIFAICGVRVFKSTMSRHCFWLDPLDPREPGSGLVRDLPFCNGYVGNGTGQIVPWSATVTQVSVGPLQPSDAFPQGYVCPQGSMCPWQRNPYNGTPRFDNILGSLEATIMALTGSGFSRMMYFFFTADYLPAAIFFVLALVCLRVWLVNFLIAGITTLFERARAEKDDMSFAAEGDERNDSEQRMEEQHSTLQAIYERTFWVWIAVIIYGLVSQSLRYPEMSLQRQRFISVSSVVVTISLDLEIVARGRVHWRTFHRSRQNIVDLVIALMTTINLTVDFSEQVQAVLSVFEILRVYRIALAVPMIRNITLALSRNAVGILNITTLGAMLMVLGAIGATELFRGDIPTRGIHGELVRDSFSNLLTSTLTLYQISSGAKWSEIVYSTTGYMRKHHTAGFAVIFLLVWFFLVVFGLMFLFIPLICEAITVPDGERGRHQEKAFQQGIQIPSQRPDILRVIFPFTKAFQSKGPQWYSPAAVAFLEGHAVQEFFDSTQEHSGETKNPVSPASEQSEVAVRRVMRQLIIWYKERLGNSPSWFRLMFGDSDTGTVAQDDAQKEGLPRDRRYNHTLFTFGPDSSIRRLCQYLVRPRSHGKRLGGVEPNPLASYAFGAITFSLVLAMIVLTCIHTPFYRVQHIGEGKPGLSNPLNLCEIAFTAIFTIEAVIKCIADGALLTPNAHYRTFGGLVDGVVLATLWANTIMIMAMNQYAPRGIRILGALRAFRLLTVIDSARDSVRALLLPGFKRTLAAMLFSFLILVSFATFFLNLFHGQLVACNDTSPTLLTLNECWGEWTSTPISNNWPILAPRVAESPYYNFDNFGNSLITTFAIVTRDGWADIFSAVQDIRGPGLQPQHNSSQRFGILLLLFNYVTAVSIITVFLAVFMLNYAEGTGLGFLRGEQLRWMALRKELYEVKPLRPAKGPPGGMRGFCDRAIRPESRWNLFLTFIIALHLAVLATEFSPEPEGWTRTRNIIFVAFSIMYLGNGSMRITAIGWKTFLGDRWHTFFLWTTIGVSITSIMTIYDHNDKAHPTSLTRAHDLLLVTIPLQLIPRVRPLYKSFTVASKSIFPTLGLLAIWFVFCLSFSIAMTQAFGLTRIGLHGDGYMNFHTVPRALLLLFRFSFGEGWNQFMGDYASTVPPYCVGGDSSLESDCGSPGWARFLFIMWNITSMFLFMNLFVAVSYELLLGTVHRWPYDEDDLFTKEIPLFREAWRKVDPEGRGSIEPEQVYKLIGVLSGVFDMRVHTDRVPDIITDTLKSESKIPVRSSKTRQLDIERLSKRLRELDIQGIRQRRRDLDLFVEELIARSARGEDITMITTLETLAYYKLVPSWNSMLIDENILRRARTQRAQEALARRRLIGFLETVFLSRKFRQHMKRIRNAGDLSTMNETKPTPTRTDAGNNTEINSEIFPTLMDAGLDDVKHPTDNKLSKEAQQASGQHLETTRPSQMRSSDDSSGNRKRPGDVLGNSKLSSSLDEQNRGIMFGKSIRMETIQPSRTRFRG